MFAIFVKDNCDNYDDDDYDIQHAVHLHFIST